MSKIDKEAFIEYEPIITTNIEGSNVAGVVVEVDEEKAKELGAFEENAMDFDEAWGSNVDLNSEVE